ncbi:MAG: hypothetical protein V3T43_02860 [Nitrosomonadaceae bacterium]
MSNTHALQAEIELIRLLKDKLSRFNNNIVFETDPDYSTVNSMIARAELPLMALEGPNMVRNDVFTSHQKPFVRHGAEIPDSGGVKSEFTEYTAEEAVDFTYETTILTRRKSDLTNAMNEVYAFLLNGKKITVERCPGDPSSGTIEYEIDLIDKFRPGRRVNNSGLKESIGTIIIRGVMISDGEVFNEGFVSSEDPNIETVLK